MATGALGAVGLGPNKFTTTMTRGTDGTKSPITGFNQLSAVGSLSSTTFFKGATCTGYYTGPGVTNFVVTLTGLFPQNYFARTINSLGTFTSASATWSQGGGSTSWSWAIGSEFATSGTETIEIDG